MELDQQAGGKRSQSFLDVLRQADLCRRCRDVATLMVNDGKVDSAAATVSVTASVANAAPVANAGSAQSVVAGSTVVLDGRGSSDANGDPLTYRWVLTAAPAGSTAALSSITAVRLFFHADLSGIYVATLKVSVGTVDSVSAFVTVDVAPVASVTLSSHRDCFFGVTQTVQSCPTQVRQAPAPAFLALQSPFTAGATVNQRFSFEILEKPSLTFSYSVQLRTNP